MALFEGLTSLDPKTLEPLPACAESWDLSEDGKVYTFHLRKNLKWSNNQPLTSQDFFYSWKRLLDPKTASSYAYLLWDLAEDGILIPDEYTFTVRLKSPCPYFLVLTAFYPLFPVFAQSEHDNVNVVCNGPYIVKLRLLKDRIRLVRNPNYWDRANVRINSIDALAVTSPMTALNLYLTGEVDWINNVPPIVTPFVSKREDFTLTPNLGVNFLRFNTTQPPLGNIKVRNAIRLAINKKELTQYVLKGGQLPANSYVPPGVPGYESPLTTVFDPVRAKKLLKEAGFPEGKNFPELNILYSSDETNRDICEVIALQLKKNLNIRIHPSAQERKGYFVSQNSLSYHICFCSWLGDYLDASTFLDVFLSNSGNNRTGWRSKEYDSLLKRASSELIQKERAAIMSKAEKILLDESPLAPLYFRTTANMISRKWAGYFDNIQDVHPLKHIRRRDP